ncbi:LuxR C-terminal-related transcriptional regulator [Actinoplanes sp. CA-030573]|uniref:helix-turn-helix transcriptional regulator n=1 Tax=Actinoplanes sp. CA-030573 TaxID=3239898 RepID=UPI003D8A3B3B
MQEPVLDDLLRAAAGGRGGALIVTGEPGSGRTTVLRSAEARAGGWAIWRAPGFHDESFIPYGGMDRLALPVDPGSCPLKAGMALVDALRRASAQRPLLWLLDDADQLDPQSWSLVRLAARRVGGLPVAIVASGPPGFAAGLPELRRLPLPDDRAHALLPPDLAGDAAAAVVRMAAGNPSALLAIAGELTPAQRRGFEPLPPCVPRGSALGDHLRARLAALPPATRSALLLAAAPPGPGLSALPVDLAVFAPAERLGLIRISGGAVQFLPAAARDVTYHDAPIAERQAAHLVLAATMSGLPSLLHRAATTTTTDHALARELVAATPGAAPELSALAFRYASELGAAPAPLLLAAARQFATAGQSHQATPLLLRLGAVPATATVRARARGLTAELTLRGDPLNARDTLLDVAAELLPADVPGALEALLPAGEACCRAGDPGRYAALVATLPAMEDDLAFRQVRGLADLMSGDQAGAFAHFRAVLALADRVDDPNLLTAAAMAAILVGRDRRGGALARRAAARAGQTGAHALVPAALEAAAYAELAAGRYEAATEAALDGAAAARRACRLDLADTHLALLAVLAALVGDRPTGEQRCRAATARTDETRDLAAWAYALLDLVEGRPAPAAARLAALVESPPGRGSAILRVAVIPHLLEAIAGAPPTATTSGHDAAELTAMAAGFDLWAGNTAEPPWLAMRARCRALRSTDLHDADDHFREALRRHEPGFARAHTALLYGRHLRRRRHHREAREHLREAVETFHRLDASPWAEQAALELRAAGERAPVAPPAGPPLTAQQERIAGLVAEGATNREVAQQLHLSPRTVDHHLRNVFARLGVRSRTELARFLTG